MIPLARSLMGSSYGVFKVAALTYISNKEVEYVKASINCTEECDTEAKLKSQKENGVQKQKDVESRGRDENYIGLKKTTFILLSVCIYISALFGPGKFKIAISLCRPNGCNVQLLHIYNRRWKMFGLGTFLMKIRPCSELYRQRNNKP